MYGFNMGYGFMPAMMSMQKPKKNQACTDNNIQLFDCFMNLTDLFLNTFEWVGLPETCNERALETALLFDGKCLFIKHHDNDGFFNCPFNFDGDSINFYGEFTRYKTNSPTYMNKLYDETNAVVIPNTRSFYPSWITLDIYSRKIVETQRILDVYQKTMKRPFLLSATKESKLTLEQIMRDTDVNEYFLLTNAKNFDPNDIKFFPIPTSPDALYALWDNLHNLQSELNKRMGIKSTNIDKAERLVKAETETATDITEQNINTMLDARIEACDKINKMFGLNISCQLKHEMEMEHEESELDEKEDNENDKG